VARAAKKSNDSSYHVSPAGSTTDLTVGKFESAPLPVSNAGLDAFGFNQLGGKDAAGEFDGEAVEVDVVSGSGGEVKFADDFPYYEAYSDYMQLPCLDEKGNSYGNVNVLFDDEAVQDGVNIGDLWSFDDMPTDHAVY
jgi:EREBP-like factor